MTNDPNKLIKDEIRKVKHTILICGVVCTSVYILWFLVVGGYV